MMYMKLNEIPTVIDNILCNMQFYSFQPGSFMVIDGFEKVGSQCLIVMNSPKGQGGTFAGIKPAEVIILSDDCFFLNKPDLIERVRHCIINLSS